MIRIAHSELHPIPLPEGHKFPFRKYELIRQQLEYQGVIDPSQLFAPSFIEDSIVHLTHDPAWWARAKAGQLHASEYRKIGFPNCEELVFRSLSSASGTVQCALNALNDGAGMNLAGGTHHAFFDHGEGFCLLNDIAVAANHLLAIGAVKRILVVDLDVHQGNGTASLFKTRPEVFTFSMHCESNYPFKKEVSDLDIGLEAGTGDQVYLSILEKQLPSLLESFKPDFVFYLGGVDVLATDRLGKLSLSREGCRRRDEFVVKTLSANKLPLVLVMGGGYSDNYSSIVNAHCETYKIVLEHYEKKRIHLA
jgi:acetoin utilization deacetylase AcuC-like enzyme